MARRASSSPPVTWVLVTLLVLVILGGAGYFVYGYLSVPYRTTSDLRVDQYLQNSDSLRGLTYKLKAKVDDTLEVKGDSRLYALETDDGKLVSLLVPPSQKNLQLEKGQTFIFKVTVLAQPSGLLQLLEAHKQ